MINLELFAQSGDHSIVQICIVVCDDPVGDAVPAYEVLLDEAGNHIFRNRGKGSCFDPLGEIVNSDQDEAMSIGCCDTVGELTWDFAFCIRKCFG